MKKTLLILLTLFFVAAFAGCDKENNEFVIQSDYSISSYDNESIFLPNNEQSNGFSTNDKKYTYEDNNLVILQIENQTKENYSITINGRYLDENGNVLKTEMQSFEQFAAGFTNHFLFQPNIQFASFDYDIAFEEYEGEIYVNDIETWFEGLTELLTHIEEQIKQGNHKRFPTIAARFGYRSKSDISLCPNGKWIVFGNDNEIVTICPISTWLYANFEDNQYSSWLIHYTTEDELTWPDNLKGELKAIYVLEEIVVENAE